MRNVRLDVAHLPPTDQRPRPIPLARRVASHEFLEIHRRCALPRTAVVSVVGNAGLCTTSRAAQNDKALRTLEQRRERFEEFVGICEGDGKGHGQSDADIVVFEPGVALNASARTVVMLLVRLHAERIAEVQPQRISLADKDSPHRIRR